MSLTYETLNIRKLIHAKAQHIRISAHLMSHGSNIGLPWYIVTAQEENNTKYAFALKKNQAIHIDSKVTKTHLYFDFELAADILNNFPGLRFES